MTFDAPAVRARQATPDAPADVAALAMLRYTWRVDERGETGEPAAFATAFDAWWQEHQRSHLAWLADRDGAPVGMAWLAVVRRVPGPEHFQRIAGIVQSVYVVPGERNAGVGGLLVEAVVTYARELELDYLTVHPSERSYALYRRAGFADTGRALELGLTEPRLPSERGPHQP